MYMMMYMCVLGDARGRCQVFFLVMVHIGFFVCQSLELVSCTRLASEIQGSTVLSPSTPKVLLSLTYHHTQFCT